MRALAVVMLALAASGSVGAQDEPTPTSPFDFALKRQFLEDLRAQRTFLPTYKIEMQERVPCWVCPGILCH